MNTPSEYRRRSLRATRVPTSYRALRLSEQPYRVPQELDLDRLTQLVAARRASAEDHLWLLRDDPNYFIHNLRDEKEQMFEALSCEGRWIMAAGSMVKDGLLYFLILDKLYRQLKDMPSLQSQFKDADCACFRFPESTEELWATFDELVDLMLELPCVKLAQGFKSSPRMRHYYNETDDSKRSPFKKYAPKSNSPETARRVNLIFHSIINIDQRYLHGPDRLVQEAQYMLDTEQASSDLVDFWLREHFCNLAFLSELRVCIDKFQPWASVWEASGMKNSKAVEECVAGFLTSVSSYAVSIEQVCGTIEGFCDPTSSQWRNPIDKRLSKENNDQMQRAERHLDSFWNDLDAGMSAATCGRSVKTISEEQSLQPRVPCHRTPAWKEENAPSKQEVETQTYSGFGEIHINRAHVPECEVSKTASDKAKLKTRGVSGPNGGVAAAIARMPEADEGLSSHRVKVAKRTFKVMSALLPPPTVEYHQRIEIAWDEFLHAMNAIGLEPENLYGSVWMFQPLKHGPLQGKLWLKRSIQFHGPKEVGKGNKIPAHMVRAFGRRLKHAYGWKDGMFVCG
ncbi:hypothetical protein KC340_g15853 [Hortaea werneckii]|nr:hypothetical protein KC323_g8991 [Hortaea werneckii]KAI7295266.1 hypothetical protein KC340_g15853 [Hortaea werneckii]KAI7344632.1 hypothetical protein KC320_g8735 [Hortaea werneckii]KAI7390353.1 hypothetical protein KC328_g7987 [Hortaea werneckii]